MLVYNSMFVSHSNYCEFSLHGICLSLKYFPNTNFSASCLSMKPLCMCHQRSMDALPLFPFNFSLTPLISVETFTEKDNPTNVRAKSLLKSTLNSFGLRAEVDTVLDKITRSTFSKTITFLQKNMGYSRLAFIYHWNSPTSCAFFCEHA